MITKLNWVSIAAFAVIAICLAVMFHSAGNAGADTQPGPKDGQVVGLNHNTQKWCDGPNLVYQWWQPYSGYGSDSGMAVIANSSECK